jgi:hypothetical protein
MASIRWRSLSLWAAASSAYRSLLSWKQAKENVHHKTIRAQNKAKKEQNP